MIDWLTLVLEVPERLYPRVAEHLRQGWQVCKWCPATGDVEWTSSCRESVRSDTHQVTVHVSQSRITISGSPARSMGLPHNVWGSDDLRECARAHVALARLAFPDWALPAAKCWRITRVDVTQNYCFGSAAEVRQALAYLRQFDGGRYKLDTRRGETVYWSPGSQLRSGKAYHKGPHLVYQRRKGQAQVSDDEIAMADRLLRLELQLSGGWWGRRRRAGEKQWSVDLSAEFAGYWGGLIGSVEVTNMNELELLEGVSPSKGQALAAYRTWGLVKMLGHREASASMPQSTWYRHKKILFDAGLGWGDLATGTVVPFRRTALVLDRPVTSWAEVRLWSDVLAA